MSIYDVPPPKTLDDLFVFTRREGNCRIWTGSFGNGNVPRISHSTFDGHSSARQFAYEKSGRKLIRKRRLYNTCKNKHCVEPSHLTYQPQVEIECHTPCFASPMDTTV